MLVGVLAISGFPLLSGWYSKDMILSSALGYSVAHPSHGLLFFLPLVTAGLTAYYMARLWFLAFAGQPRDHHVHDHAHETPWVMTLPLVVLAAASIGVGWGWPVWNVEASALGHTLHEVTPAARADFEKAHHYEHEYHLYAGGLALVAAALGLFAAYSQHRSGKLLAFAPPFLVHKWYFDELYAALFHRPTVDLARASAAVDKRPAASFAEEARVDTGTLDGALNALGQLVAQFGANLRRAQTGQIRQYVLVLALTVAGVLGILTALTR
jgi:NADH-quinone oxidoreductase subunit L